MGQVWLAADQVLGRLVAVKLLRPEYAEHPETLERFRAEARHAGVLNHPHIAQVYDYGPFHHARGAVFPGDCPGPFREPYLVMEYVDGPSLAEVIERGTLSADFTCDVMAQAASGLDAAHRAGLVHRDIKPGNLLLTCDGRVKVTDFGIAHAAGSAPITAPGIVMGTSLYMAPERIAGGPGTPASDLYSLGIVMWECLLGQPPFRGTSPDVMAAHLHQALPPLPAWVPAPVCELVARLTAKDPAYRLSDAGLLAAQLRSLELVGVGSRERGLSGYAPEWEGPLPWPGLGRDFPPGPGPDLELVSPDAGYLSAPPGAVTVLLARARGAATGPAWHGARRQGVAVAVVAFVVAGLAAGGLATSGAFGAAPTAQQDSAGPPATASGTSAGAGAYIQVPSFHGQQYATVGDWLRGHGLTARIDWDDRSGLPTGTVVSVSPSGQVPAGSTVTVTIAWNSDAPPPTAAPSLTPGARPGKDASAAGGGSAQLGAGTSPGAGTAPVPSTAGTAPPAPEPTTVPPTPGSHASTGAAPTPSPTCAFPLGPVCFSSPVPRPRSAPLDREAPGKG